MVVEQFPKATDLHLGPLQMTSCPQLLLIQSAEKDKNETSPNQSVENMLHMSVT
jgi:hypothetical protein